MHSKLVANFTPQRKYFPPGEIPPRLNLPKSRQIQLLGKKDQLIEWFKPSSKPSWMSREDYRAMPLSLTGHQLEYQIHEPGFRTRTIVVMTTLLDSACYPSHEIAALYLRRWEIEVNFDHLKITMKMDILKS